MNSARIDFVPYQFRPALKLIHADEPRILIADSVGVGKTIEAGLIIKELQARNELENIMIICPKPLVTERKWETEMKRFDEDFIPLTGPELRQVIPEDSPELGNLPELEEDEDSPAGNVRIDISGGICGMDLRNGAPVRGDFQCIARLADSGFAVYAVNLPRQISSEDEILISVSRNGKELFSCDISEAISKTGFDWSKPDLDDIRLGLNYISASVNVEIAEWETSPGNDKVI